MPEIHTNIIIANKDDASRQAEVRFLYDSGSNTSLVPSSILDALGVERMESTTASLANDNTEKVEVGRVAFILSGERFTAEVVFGKDTAEPLLSYTVLDIGRFTINEDGALAKKTIKLRRLRTFTGLLWLADCVAA